MSTLYINSSESTSATLENFIFNKLQVYSVRFTTHSSLLAPAETMRTTTVDPQLTHLNDKHCDFQLLYLPKKNFPCANN